MEEGVPAPENRNMLTVGHLIDSFDAACVVSVRTGQITESTRVFYLHQLRKLRTAAGHYPADALRAHHLVNVEFTNHFVRAVKRLYSWAADEELIPKNVFKKLKTPSAGQRTRILNADEFGRLLSVCGRPFRRFLEVARETASRPGELRTLRRRSVQVDQRLILLTEFKAKDKRKDGQAVRRIPLTVRAAELLAEALGERPGDGPDDFVFRGDRGRPWTANGLRCQMRVARKKAGLDDGGERVVCYTLRHTRATDLTRKGVRDNTLAEIMGHTTTQMTRRYQHLTGADLCNVLDEADA